MTYLHRRFRTVLLSFASLVTLPMTGCSSGPSAVCPCPSGGAQISVAALPASVASASAESPCTVSNLGNGLLVNSTRSGTCEVHVQLTDGETYASSVTFTGGSGCCPYTYFGTASALEKSDAGTN